jgi:hypothetical protein
MKEGEREDFHGSPLPWKIGSVCDNGPDAILDAEGGIVFWNDGSPFTEKMLRDADSIISSQATIRELVEAGRKYLSNSRGDVFSRQIFLRAITEAETKQGRG